MLVVLSITSPCVVLKVNTTTGTKGTSGCTHDQKERKKIEDSTNALVLLAAQKSIEVCKS